MRFRASFFGALAIAIVLLQPAYGGSLKFTAEVPRPPADLPLLRLTPQPAPIALVEKLLSDNGAVKLVPLGNNPLLQKYKLKLPESVVGIIEEERMRAWVDRKTGDLAIYTVLSKLEPLSQADAGAHLSKAREIFNAAEFIARDDTRIVVEERPNTLYGQTLVRDANGAVRSEKPKTPYLSYISARRFVGELAVDGPGSRALLQLGAKGSVEGLMRVWKSAKTVQKVKTARSAEQVRNEIARQFKPVLVSADVTVDRIELAYYDSNNRFLQPVYRFTAQIHYLTMPRTPARTNDNYVIGYIPFGSQAYEALPVLGQSAGPNPGAPPKESKQKPPGKGASIDLLDPTVGRYVVRNDDAGWVNDANAFWSSLRGTWTGSLFTNSQYYWAEPRLFTNQKNSFVNSVNLALIEVHGDWFLFSTLQNCCDLVNINGDIPSPGYGPSAGGALATWIIHSCEVVPGPDDTASWPDPWWTIFGGVRNVVGYRTIMYISDGAGGPYGTSLGNFAPVVSSWLSDVMSLNAYSGHPKAMAHGGINRPMGRPSTISMCGHDGDTVFPVSTLGRANCLTVWWFPD